MNCKLCEDKGWYWVPNGPDDVDKEVCDCYTELSQCEPDEDAIRESVRDAHRS